MLNHYLLLTHKDKLYSFRMIYLSSLHYKKVGALKNPTYKSSTLSKVFTVHSSQKKLIDS